MDIITDIMNLILRFRLQLASNPLSQPLSHMAFDAMMRTKDEFQQQAMLLYASLKASLSSSKHHLISQNQASVVLGVDGQYRDPLTLLLNFNTFYEVDNV